MKVNTVRKELQEVLPLYEIVEDCIQGEARIKSKGEKYLNRDRGLDSITYNNIKNIASFVPVTNRAIDGFIGLLTMETPIFNASERFKEFVYKNGVDLNRRSPEEFYKNEVETFFTYGRMGMLTDYIKLEEVSNMKQAEMTKNRAISSIYSGAEIINWKYRYGDLVLVVLKENFCEESEDFFVDNNVEQYRVLRIDSDGFYVQEVYRENEDGDFYVHDSFDIFLNGQRLNFIPFKIRNYDGSDPDTVPNPPLYDMCSLNIKHYNNSADLESASHIVGTPTPVMKKDLTETEQDNLDEDINPAYDAIVNGYERGSSEFVFGINSMNVIGINESVEYLEFQGTGLSIIKQLMEEKKDEMGKIGARFLVDEKAGAESYETEKLRRSGEFSIVASIGISCGEALRESMEMMNMWMFNDTSKIEYIVNTDFGSSGHSIESLRLLLDALLNGKLPFEDFYQALKENKLVSNKKEASVALDKIREEYIV